MIAEYSALFTRSIFPEIATDLIRFRHKYCPENPDFYVSLSDIETQKARGKNQVPIRDKKGFRKADVWERLQHKKAEKYAKVHGWPFSFHIANLQSDHYEQSSKKTAAHCPYTGEQRSFYLHEPLPLGWKWGRMS